jgi:hypothetical protein
MHNDTTAVLLQRLGLSAAGAQELETIPLGAAGVAQGFQAGGARARDLSDSYVELAVDTALPFLLTRHALEPTVVRVEQAAVIRGTSGSAEPDEETVLLDGRQGRRAAVVVDSAEGPMLIAIEEGAVHIRLLASPDEGEALERWQPLTAQLAHPVPSIVALLGERGCEPWLQARVDQLAASTWLVDQVASVGTLLRLWSPTANDAPGAAPAGSAHPSTAIGAWIRALSPDERSLIERLAVQQAAALRRRLDALDALDEGAPELAPAELLALLHERDALESVVALLWLCGEGRGLGAQLALLDDLALVSLSALPLSPALDDDALLQAVFTGEPDAWWGKLAAG